MNIYAVIVTYNAMRRNWIERCIQSLQRSTCPVDIVVVDNGSTDGTRDYVPKHYQNIIWLPQQKNLGFGQANNVGIKYAMEHEADYVLLLNQDATIKEDSVEQMIKVCGDDTLVSPIQLNGDGTRLDTLFKYVLLQADNQLIDDMLVKGNVKCVYENGRYAAACWLLPATVIKKVGGFNPLFFQYSEDYNYLHRIKYHHLKVVLATHAFMCHDRDIHGNNSVFSKKELHREMLLSACDINMTSSRCLVKWCKLLLRSYTSKLPRLQYIPGTFAWECFWFILHIRSIRSSRKIERHEYHCWL